MTGIYDPPCRGIFFQGSNEDGCGSISSPEGIAIIFCGFWMRDDLLFRLFKVSTWFCLQAVIKKKYGQDATNVGDEGGFAPNIQVCIHIKYSQDEINLSGFVLSLVWKQRFLLFQCLYSFDVSLIGKQRGS